MSNDTLNVCHCPSYEARARARTHTHLNTGVEPTPEKSHISSMPQIIDNVQYDIRTL